MLEWALLFSLLAVMVPVSALLFAMLVLGAVPGSVPEARADDAATLTARARALCQRADALSDKQARQSLREGLRLAELAVELDDGNARAHFAVFCNLGKLTERRGVGLGSIHKVQRLQRVIDRTLELDPDFVAANIAKAELLRRLPRFLGGDPEAARHYRARATALKLHGGDVAAVETGTSNLAVTAAVPDTGS